MSFWLVNRDNKRELSPLNWSVSEFIVVGLNIIRRYSRHNVIIDAGAP